MTDLSSDCNNQAKQREQDFSGRNPALHEELDQAAHRQYPQPILNGLFPTIEGRRKHTLFEEIEQFSSLSPFENPLALFHSSHVLC